MTFQEVCEGIKAGIVTFDTCGHQVNNSYQEDLLQHYQHALENAAGAKDGKWNLCDNENMAVINAKMREFYEHDLKFEWKEDQKAIGMPPEVYCCACGHRLHWVRNGQVLALRQYWNGERHLNYPSDYRCPFEHAQPTRGEIRIKSQMVLANFFTHVRDEPEDEEHSDKWNLNSLLGRTNITRYKAERNVAYGQMGNMSVGIYVHPERKSVIIGDAYILDRRCDGMTEAEYDAADHVSLSKIEDHEWAGQFSLCVWRWEATDMVALGEEFHQIALERFGENNVVVLDVPHGRWSFEHYYDTDTSPDKAIYARLRWEGE
jgi:hypothetical protein